jgi:23S rRNA (guanine745-N1)-methyltransferase
MDQRAATRYEPVVRLPIMRLPTRVHAGLLACPHCREPLEGDGGTLRCARGHAFDVARQGYVSLIAGGGLRHHGDTRAMVDARAEFLGGGHFDPIAEAAVNAAAVDAPGAIVDVGAGTGHYLARLLDAHPERDGLALDASRHAAVHAARSHPRTRAVVCDAWGDLPVRSGVAAVVLNVFAPRNPAEMRRILHDRGLLVVVRPTERHLRELVGPLGLVTVEEHKEERLAEAVDPWFEHRSSESCEYTMSLGTDALRALVMMGPSARHVEPADLRDAEVTASVVVSAYGPRP